MLAGMLVVVSAGRDRAGLPLHVVGVQAVCGVGMAAGALLAVLALGGGVVIAWLLTRAWWGK